MTWCASSAFKYTGTRNQSQVVMNFLLISVSLCSQQNLMLKLFWTFLTTNAVLHKERYLGYAQSRLFSCVSHSTYQFCFLKETFKYAAIHQQYNMVYSSGNAASLHGYADGINWSLLTSAKENVLDVIGLSYLTLWTRANKCMSIV